MENYKSIHPPIRSASQPLSQIDSQSMDLLYYNPLENFLRTYISRYYLWKSKINMTGKGPSDLNAMFLPFVILTYSFTWEPLLLGYCI